MPSDGNGGEGKKIIVDVRGPWARPGGRPFESREREGEVDGVEAPRLTENRVGPTLLASRGASVANNPGQKEEEEEGRGESST